MTTSQTRGTITRDATDTTVISTVVPCQWTIPPTPGGQAFDPGLLNVRYSTGQGSPPVALGYVPSAVDCSTFGGGWFYDNPNVPTRILVCPTTCTVLTNAQNASVTFTYGCQTRPAG
jgi:hypothetical protein